MGAGCYCWVTRKGRSHYCSLSPPTCWCLPTDNKRSPFRAGPCTLTTKQLKKVPSGLALACLLPGARKSPARAGTHTPYAGCQKRPSLGPYLLHLWCWLPCAFGATGDPVIQAVVPSLCPVLTGADPRAPRQPQNQTPVCGPHTKVGIKPKQIPRDEATKEEDQKSFHQL